MARVTVEDCVGKVGDKFELVLITAQRARAINSGARITVDRDNDKDAVVALREIAAGQIKPECLKEELIQNLQMRNKLDPIDDENLQGSDDDSEKFDYIPSGSDLHVSEDHSDLDNDEMFGVNDIEDGKDKGF